jgi:cellulose synthase/poly-beta-1,6-N-acetylglucosamine synthase-like glycosyltransferase
MLPWEETMAVHKVYFLHTNPRSWIRASLPKYIAAAHDALQQMSGEQLQGLARSQRDEHIQAAVIARQERRWRETTGVDAADSYFTLVIPVYNEEHSLPSFFSTLMLADIPSSVHATIIFITNACHDASNSLIDAFLARQGDVEEEQLRGDFLDAHVNPYVKTVKLGNITFMHVDTSTPGKGHALRTGNCIARSCGHTMAMCIDANDYIEPDAVRLLFRAAHQTFRRQPALDDVVIFSGTGCGERRASSMKKIMDAVEVRKRHLIEDRSGYILGCLMAWNTEWLDSIGGPLGIALEDYALGVLARVYGYRIGVVEEARIWSYDANAFADLLETRTRYVRGMLQVLYSLQYTAGAVRIVQRDSFYMRNWRERLRHLLRRSSQDILSFPRYLATFLIWEYAIRRGRRDFWRDPENPTWKKIASTR